MMMLVAAYFAAYYQLRHSIIMQAAMIARSPLRLNMLIGLLANAGEMRAL